MNNKQKSYSIKIKLVEAKKSNILNYVSDIKRIIYSSEIVLVRETVYGKITQFYTNFKIKVSKI